MWFFTVIDKIRTFLHLIWRKYCIWILTECWSLTEGRSIIWTGQGTGHCPAGIFKNIISNVTKNEEAGHGLVLSLQLESAIQQYQRCERKLGFTVTDIRGKVDTIKEHFDKVLKDATTKLQVSVNVAGAGWNKIKNLFIQEHKWMLAKMQEHIREVNGMFAEERRWGQKRFFVLSFFMFTSVIVMMVCKGLHWF